MKKRQAFQALSLTLMTIGGIALALIIWKTVQGTPAETPVILASALMFAAIILWGKKEPASQERLEPTRDSERESKEEQCRG